MVAFRRTGTVEKDNLHVAPSHDTSGLPITWPFRAAGTLTMIALAWFCVGFALEDVGEHLPRHMDLFWILLLISFVLVVGGGVYNSRKD